MTVPCYWQPLPGSPLAEGCPKCAHPVLAHRRDGEPGPRCRLCQLDELLGTLEELAELGGVNGLRGAVARAEQPLVEWAAVYRRRDDVICAAYVAGVPKRRIWRITGIARTTIDSILTKGGVNGAHNGAARDPDGRRAAAQD